jgi:hypothetical protein
VDARADQHGDLAERDVRILEFEDRRWRNPGAKEQAVRLEFGMSAARYYQVLNTLIDSPAAARYDPLLVGRLRRLRTGRTRTEATH